MPEIVPLTVETFVSTLPRASYPPWLRRCALGMGSVFLWTMTLAAPVDALAHPSQKPALPKYHAPLLPKPADDPAWHTIDYHKAEKARAGSASVSGRQAAARLTLLDEVGRLEQAAAPTQVTEWKRQLHRPGLSPNQAALLHIHAGEVALAQDEQPEQARWHFRQAQGLAKQNRELRGLAAYDDAIGAYYEGAYGEARQAFKNLLTNRTGLRGFDRRTAALFWRHASACAGYHAERAKLGIPEPPKLDPLCGASAVASALKAAGKPFDKKTVLANLRVTGRGSSMQDVLDGAAKLGLSGHVVAGSDNALRTLPKPLVAYVEHDHFVSVLGADKQGVTYLCADCGPWPGGKVHLSWAQWHRMEATAFAPLVKPGSDVDGALALLSAPNEPAKPGVQIAGMGPQLANGVVGRLRLLKLFRQQGINNPVGGQTYNCGSAPGSQQCQCPTNCADDHTKKGVTPGGGSGPGSSNPGGGGGDRPSMGGPADGVGVNTGNGQLTYITDPDITVYNPNGPSLSWSFTYQSLRGDTASQGYESTDFGQGFSHPYNIGIVMPPNSPQVYLMESNGSRVSLTAPQAPDASTPSVVCTVQAGIPLLAEWDYNPATSSTYFVLTQPDRSQMVMQTGYDCFTGSSGGSSPRGTQPRRRSSPILWYPLSQIKDSVGNAVNFNYTNPPTGVYPVLTSITDKNNAALLTFTRDGNNAVQQVSDRYGRSVYYHVGSYATAGVPVPYAQSYAELDHVSQVVATGTASPPDRHVFGYQNVGNGEGSEAIPLLHTVAAPSPTGTGTQTATINYLAGLSTVSSVTDGNGNTRSYNQTDANHTQVNVTDAANNTVYRYTAGYDMNLSVTSITNGTVDGQGHNTQVIASLTYADANDPLRPSEVQDAVGYQSSGAGGQGTTDKTWDSFGNCLTMTSARGTTTTLSYNYANFALGEMTSVQEGAKTPTTFSYYEPSGLIHTMTRPAPGSAGNASQTVSYSYTYDALGNMLTATGPGNNAATTETVTLNYTQDGSYSQTEALNQPLTKTDSLGHVRHFRYDTLGRCIARIDAFGNETDTTFNSVGQGTSVTFAATGETGTGRAQVVNTFLYPGGPQTSLTQYNEAGTSVYQELNTYGKEGEELTRTGSTQPVSQTYDGLYRLKTVTDGNSHSTQYSYGAGGYLSQIQYPNGDTVQVTSYDLNGNPLQKVDGRGVITNLTYNDVESRLTDIAYPANTALNVHISYDGYGRKSGIADGSGSQAVSYDDQSNLTGVTTTYTGLAAQTLNYAYYPDGSRQTLTLPDNSTYTDTYDAAGRHTGLTSPGGHSFSWTYADNNWLTSQTSDNTIVTTPTRDARGFITDLTNRRTDIPHTLLSDFALTYSSNMTLGSMTSTVSGVTAFSGTTTYAHDTKLQLTQESSNRAGGYTNNNGYDGAGNPTTFKGVGQTFNNANQNTASTYDGNGNPTGYKGNTLAFDVENRLTAYGSVLTAGYRADGQRAWKQNSGGKTYFFYDGDKLLYETNSTGTITAKNVWADTGLLARSTSTPNRTLLYTWDAQGNVCQQLDASTGNIVESYMFDAFGTRATSGTDTAAMNDPYSGFGGSQGYYQDAETGLQLLGHRYYDPATGRFLNRDPINYEGGVNLYEYCNNSPLSMRDASGMVSLWDCIKEGIGAIVTGAGAECAGTLAKLIAQNLTGSAPCDSQQLCQAAMNCFADGLFEIMCECLITPMLGGNVIAAGCLCGALGGGLHYVIDLGCAKANPCGEPRHINGWCLLINVAEGTLSGCVGGLLSPGIKGVQDPSFITELLGKLGMSGMSDFGADGLCQQLHLD